MRRKFDAAMSEICRLKANANSGKSALWLDRCFETLIRNILFSSFSATERIESK